MTQACAHFMCRQHRHVMFVAMVNLNLVNPVKWYAVLCNKYDSTVIQYSLAFSQLLSNSY